MKAAVVTAYGGPEVIEIRDIASPQPGPGQVAIDVEYAGINYAEVLARRGVYPHLQPPFVPGLEVSGRVRTLGKDVEDLSVGQAVSALTSKGGYAEVAVAPAALTYPLPADADEDLRVGAALPTIVPAAWMLINEVAHLAAGENVLIHAAAGGVGTVAGQVARLSGAHGVYGVAGTAEKCEYARAFGYDDVFLADDWVSRAREVTDGRGLDVILDSVGGEVREQAFELLAPMGRLVIFGNASGIQEVAPPAATLRSQSKAVLGFSIMGLAAADPQRVRRTSQFALDAVAKGRLRLDITEVFDLEEAAEAHKHLESRRSRGKLVIAVGADIGAKRRTYG
jgi:NADPH:quinone reductase